MPKWDDLKPLPDHVAPLLRALISISRRPESRLILQPVTEERLPFYDLRDDYNVTFRGKRVGRITYDHKPYANEAHMRWRWFLNDTQRNRMANERCATREEAMAAFRKAFDRVADNTVDKSA
jgi:hypothetical protein